MYILVLGVVYLYFKHIMYAASVSTCSLLVLDIHG